MAVEPRWLDAEKVVEFNYRIVTKSGEPFNVLNPGLLSSAVARPQNAYGYGERDIIRLGAQLLYGIANNHPFEQGNKRTAFAAFSYFLVRNGHQWRGSNSEQMAREIEAMILGKEPSDLFADRWRHVVQIK